MGTCSFLRLQNFSDCEFREGGREGGSQGRQENKERYGLDGAGLCYKGQVGLRLT